MLESGVPKFLLEFGAKIRKKTWDEVQEDYKKFSNSPHRDLEEDNDRLPSTKRFTSSKADDYGLSDKISDKPFTFKQVGNSFLLDEQLPSSTKFRISSGIKGVNEHFDNIGLHKDYSYTDPKFYEYRLKGMTQQKLIENKWMQQGDDLRTEDVDPTTRAINIREQINVDYADKIINNWRASRDQRAYQDVLQDVKGDKDGKALLNNLYKEENEKQKNDSKAFKENVREHIQISKAKRNSSINQTYTKNQNELIAKENKALAEAEALNKPPIPPPTPRKKGMNADQKAFSEFSTANNKIKREARKEAHNEEKAIEFYKKNLAKRTFSKLKTKTTNTKIMKARGVEKGLVIEGTDDTTPGPPIRYVYPSVYSTRSKKDLALFSPRAHSSREEEKEASPRAHSSREKKEASPRAHSSREEKKESPKGQTFLDVPTEKEASIRIQNLARQRKAKNALHQLKEDENQKEEKNSPTIQEKRVQSALNREKEAEEYKRIQNESKKFQANEELQIKTYEKIREDLGKLNKDDIMPKTFFKDLRVVYTSHNKTLGVKYKVSTVLTQLEKWEDQVLHKKSNINENKSKEAKAHAIEKKLFADQKTPRSKNIHTADEILLDDIILEEKDTARRVHKPMVTPSKNDLEAIITTGRSTGRK